MQGADFGMVSSVTRRKAECLEEILGNVSRSISPSASLAAGGDFFKELLLRLNYFVRCKSRDGTTHWQDSPRLHVGEAGQDHEQRHEKDFEDD